MSSPASPRVGLALALEYPLAYGGGVSVLVRELIRQLAADFVIFLVSPDSPETLAQAGVVEQLAGHHPWQPARASRAAARELASVIAGWGVQLAHFHSGGLYGWGNRRPGTSPLPFLDARGVACITTVHYISEFLEGALPPDLPAAVRPLFAPVVWLGRLYALLATEVEVAVCQYHARQLQRWYLPVRKRFRALYHSRLPATPAIQVSANERERVILHVGHRAERKGQLILLEAFAQIARRHPQWRLRLVGPPGEAAYEQSLRDSVSTHGLQSRIAIEDHHPAASELMRTAAVYVQPAFGEGLPLALQEAMYYGCANIGTRVAGIPELIQHEVTGLLVAPGDVAQLARALERLVENEALRSSLGAQGAQRVAQLGMSCPEMAEQHRKLYRKVLRRAAA